MTAIVDFQGSKSNLSRLWKNALKRVFWIKICTEFVEGIAIHLVVDAVYFFLSNRGFSIQI